MQLLIYQQSIVRNVLLFMFDKNSNLTIMKNFFSILILLIFWTNVNGQTALNGIISSNTSLSLAQSPYLISSNLTVNTGVTLTVPTGVIVKLDAGANIFVEGALNATGATFTSSLASPTRGSWGQIVFGNGSNSGTSTLNGTSIRWGYSVRVLNNYTANFTNTSTITEFSYRPVDVEVGGTASLTNSTISNSDFGVFSNGTLSLTGSSINSLGANTGITANSGSLTLNNSSILNCNKPIDVNAPISLAITGSSDFLSNNLKAISINLSSLTSGNFTLPGANVAYVFPSNFTVESGATLTVQNNAILKFNTSTSLIINGTLSANGSVAGNANYFTSIYDDNWGGDSNGDGGATSPSAVNYWQGIKLNESSVDANCILRRSQIRFANYCIETEDANPTINLCEFTSNIHGLSLLRASNPIVSQNTFGSSSLTPVAMSFESNPSFTNNVFNSSDNQFDAIGLYGGTLSSNANIVQRSFTTTTNITYVLLSQVVVPIGRTLTIQPGVVIKTQSWTISNIIIQGTLLANGTAIDPIVITSVKDDNFGSPFDTNKDGSITSPAVGDFSSIVFQTGSTGNSLNFCKVKYANGYNSSEQNFSGAALNFISAGGTVANCEIKDVTDGINCFLSANPAINNNQFINLNYPVTLSASANPTFTGNTLTNVLVNALGLIGAGFQSDDLNVSGTIQSKNFAGYTNITYVLRRNVAISSGTNITISEGVVIKSTGYVFTVNGGLKINGTVSNPVTFTALSDDNFGNPLDTDGNGNAASPMVGQGPSIYFTNTSDDAFSNLTYLRTYYSLYTVPLQSNVSGAVILESSNAAINNVSFNSFQIGLAISGNSSPTVSNCTFQNSPGGFPISISLLSNPTFTGTTTFTSIGYSGILINDINLSSNASLLTRSLAGFTNIPYILNQTLTINSGSTLQLQQGVIIKFIENYFCGQREIRVKGSLVTNGIVSSKIVFTSIRDDSAGGDTNNDGNSSNPFAGIYGGIIFEDESVDATNNLTYTEIRFGGGGCSILENIKFINSGGILNNVTISNCTAGVGVFGSANPNLQNVTLQNMSVPVRMDMFSNPTFGAITTNNISNLGLHIPASTYSQNNTFPIRSFAGIANITYVIEGQQNVNSGTTIIIPSGMTFKSNWWNNSDFIGLFFIEGRLNINGTASQPVVFTRIEDDAYGNPADIQNNGAQTDFSAIPNSFIYFSDVANDASSISNAIFRFKEAGVNCFSSSPTITNSQFSNCNNGILLTGNSTPSVTNNTFNNLSNTPILTSILCFPSSVTGNVISGSTFKGIGIINETLSQDVTLPKRSFGGIANIPYYFNGFTVGTTATLTIDPGIVTKWQGGGINVIKGLDARGGFRADSNIVFTSWRDDEYGGDFNADGTNSIANIGDWSGINFDDFSLDPLCKFKNCIIRNASSGVTTNNASPDIQKVVFYNCGTGVYANGASNPSVNFCDFYNTANGINNVNQAFNINAENCWWGNNTGPAHSANALGTGSTATDQVDYLPFRTTGPNTPLAGDVSLNGTTQSFDAARILQHIVSLITLSSLQQTVGDVSGAQGLTSFDASLILQYSVGLIDRFPSEELRLMEGESFLEAGQAQGLPGEMVTVPVMLNNIAGLMGSSGILQFDTTKLEYQGIMFEELGMNTADNMPVNGEIRFAMAGVSEMVEDGIILNLQFRVKENVAPGTIIPIVILNYIGNESDLTANAINGAVEVPVITGIISLTGNVDFVKLYPNPVQDILTLDFSELSENEELVINIYDNLGRLTYSANVKAMQTNAGNFNIDLSSILNGQYILVAHSGTRMLKKRVLIQH